MKVLLLSVTAGQGHNSCARSIMDALKKRDVECVMLDTIKYISEVTGTVIDKGYVGMGKWSPRLWGMLYTQALKASIKGLSIDKIHVPSIVSNKIVEFIEEYKPDIIISTHIAASLLLTSLRKKGAIHVPVIGVNTDFALHPFWEDVDEDYLVLACDKMHYSVRKRGIPDENTLPYGIPIHEKFTLGTPKKVARESLNIENKLTLLLMSGSMGFGNMIDHISELDTLPHDFQTIVVCGSNKSLYEEICKNMEAGKYKKKLYVNGFVNNIDTLMFASDIICTKPGGLSLSESLSVGRPIVMLDPIPGLEVFNVAFLVNCGAAVQTGEYYSVPEAIHNLLSSPKRISSMLRAQQELSPRDSAQKLSDFIINMI